MSHPASAVRTLLRPSERALHQFVRYAVVGGPAFFADFGTLWLLASLGVNVLWATALASLAGMAVNYGLCTSWVFPRRSVRARWLELSVFFGVGLTGLGLNVLLMDLLSRGAGLHYLLAKPVCAVAVLGWTFTARKLTLFRGRVVPEAPALAPVPVELEL